ncbi:hypothetical protein, partial [Bordetella pertussis]|uniref:hypothetical protein n=1 Tax=Bordetella pertussis TaxID=520 RepID=UPI0021CB9001
TARALGDAGLALARQAYPAVSSRYLLAMHGKAALRAAGLPQATLLSALLMSDRGAALTAPAQQLMLQHGLLAAYAPGRRWPGRTPGGWRAAPAPRGCSRTCVPLCS